MTISDPPTQAEVQALREKCEEPSDDVRALATLVHALRGAFVGVGVVRECLEVDATHPLSTLVYAVVGGAVVGGAWVHISLAEHLCCNVVESRTVISFIIPAYNEELWIGNCLADIRAAMEGAGELYEVIVVDDASTDATVQIAQERSAKVLRVDYRNIARTRNAGALTARGEVLFFIDADTRASREAVCAGLRAMRAGAAGGGSVFQFDRRLPLSGRILHAIGLTTCRILCLAGGCFLFCSREAYIAVGGFPEQFYAAEDLAFVLALKKVGRFVVTKPTVITSGRKLDVVNPWELIRFLLAIGIRGPYHRTRDKLDFLYGRQAQDCKRSRRTRQDPPLSGEVQL